MRYELTRKQLKATNIMDFKDGDVVVCGKYFIQIRYKNHEYTFSRPSLLTTVSTRFDLRNLKISAQPYYIRDFIEGGRK